MGDIQLETSHQDTFVCDEIQTELIYCYDFIREVIFQPSS